MAKAKSAWEKMREKEEADTGSHKGIRTHESRFIERPASGEQENRSVVDLGAFDALLERTNQHIQMYLSRAEKTHPKVHLDKLAAMAQTLANEHRKASSVMSFRMQAALNKYRTYETRWRKLLEL